MRNSKKLVTPSVTNSKSIVSETPLLWSAPSSFTLRSSLYRNNFLVESYGSDADVIQTVIEKKYPNGKYFWLCDFIDDEKRQEKYFHIRVWELNDSMEENESSELLKGEDVDRFYTVGNWNNNETIGVVANKKNYRLRVGELNKIKNLIRFKIDLASNSNDGRRTNNYLEIVKN